MKRLLCFLLFPLVAIGQKPSVRYDQSTYLVADPPAFEAITLWDSNASHRVSIEISANVTANRIWSFSGPDAAATYTLPSVSSTLLATDGSGASLTALNATQLTSGTIPDARFPSTLPAISGVNLTNLNATNLASGTVPNARLDAELSAIAGLTSAADRVPYFTGSGSASVSTFTSFGRSLVDDADSTAGRSTLGLGTIATQNADSVSFTGGNMFTMGTGTFQGLGVFDTGFDASHALFFAVGSDLTDDRTITFITGDEDRSVTLGGNFEISGTSNLTFNVSASTNVTLPTSGTLVADGSISDSGLTFTQTGTGATARGVDSKLTDEVSAKDFGATGDGTTNDYAAIQAALNTGKDVFLPATSGSEITYYQIGTALEMNKVGQRLRGEGWRVRLRTVNSGQNAINIRPGTDDFPPSYPGGGKIADVKVEDLIIIATFTDTGTGINASNGLGDGAWAGDEVTLRNVLIFDFDVGIDFDGVGQSMMWNTIVSRCTYGVKTRGAGSNSHNFIGLRCSQATAGLTITDVQGGSRYFLGDFTTNTNDVVFVSGNTTLIGGNFEGASGHCIVVGAALTHIGGIFTKNADTECPYQVNTNGALTLIQCGLVGTGPAAIADQTTATASVTIINHSGAGDFEESNPRSSSVTHSYKSPAITVRQAAGFRHRLGDDVDAASAATRGELLHAPGLAGVADRWIGYSKKADDSYFLEDLGNDRVFTVQNLFTAKQAVTSSSTTWKLRVGNNSTEEGGFIQSDAAHQLYLMGGGYYGGGANLTARATTASGILLQSGTLDYYSATGLSVGGTWTLGTPRFGVSNTGLFRINNTSLSGQFNVVSSAAGTSVAILKAAASPSSNIVEVRDSADAVKVGIESDFNLVRTAGTSSTKGSVPCVLSVGTSSTGNVGAGEDNLSSYSIPANSEATNGDYIEFVGAGTIANNANAKRIKVKYGATTIFDTGAMPVSASIDWSIEGRIIRTGAATQKCIVSMNTNNATLASFCDYTTAAETLSGAVTLQFTGEAVSDNDIVQEILTAEYKPAP